jgi:hypothetical protein
MTDAIGTIVAGLEKAWNKGRGTAVAASFADDAG